MLEFKKEIINGSFNKINKTGREADSININIKSKDKNVDVRLAGKGLWVTVFLAAAPTAICVLGATIAACAVTKTICARRNIEEGE